MSYPRPTNKPLSSPELDWDQDRPQHPRYQDGYFSADNGQAEARHVFLDNNRLSARFARASQFCIAELGFGTGLNFLLTRQLWQAQARPGARLDYIAVEGQPLEPQQMRRALSPWPALARESEELCGRLPPPTAGFHCVRLADNLALHLLYGDVSDTLPQLRARVDAWFLDGFAPSRNPAMWSEAVLDQVVRLSNDGTSFATYTAAGHVRRGLQARGFTVEKRPGYGRKREMLTGHVDRASARHQHWSSYPHASGDRNITILGAGLSGACLARTLAEQGWRVHVIGGEQGASHRIPGFLVRPYPEAQASPSQRLYARAFHEAVSLYQQRVPEHFQRLRLTSANGPVDAGLVRGPQACDDLLNHPNIRQTVADDVVLRRENTHWVLQQPASSVRTAQLVLCCGMPPSGLDHLFQAPLTPCAGQAICIDQQIQQAFAGGVHGFPLGAMTQIGSSYRPGSSSLEACPDDSRGLLTQCAHDWPALGVDPDTPVASCHTGRRSSVRDHLPLIGPCPDLAQWPTQFADIHHGERALKTDDPPKLLPGLWLNLGHGSRGATCAPLAAQVLAAALNGQPVPLEEELLRAIHPGRFAIRQLRRGRPVWPTDSSNMQVAGPNRAGH